MKGDAAIVTGASSGIGLAISRVLCRLGYEVFGIGRNFNTEFEAESFHKIICDILDTDRLCDTAKQIAAQNRVTLLVNNAGTAYYGLHEELNPRKISQMVRTNLEAPMILTCQLLRELKKKQRIYHQYILRHGRRVQSPRLRLRRHESRAFQLFPQPV